MYMNPDKDQVVVGSQVEIELTDRAGKKERLSLVIVRDESADFTHGFMSEHTALAKALLGERTGSVIPYLKDDIFSIEILSVSAAANLPPEGAAEKRKAKLRKTIRQVEDTNAMVFASSFSGKWGDYDPDSIPKDKTADEKD